MTRRAALPATLALLALAGCGGPAVVTVSGAVTVDGKPLARGVISFAPADGVGPPATAEVVDGKYELRTAPGKKTVRLSAPVVTGKRKESTAPGAPEVELTAEGLPDKYNAATELAYEVPPGGGTKDWAVEGRRKK